MRVPRKAFTGLGLRDSEHEEHTEHVENCYPAQLEGAEIANGVITAMPDSEITTMLC